VIEVSCQSCGEKVGVQSFLAAAEQPCGRCGQLLMGALARGTRIARPAGFEEVPSPGPYEHGSGSAAALWLGVLTGILAGVTVVGAIAYLGPAIPLRVRGAVLGALSGVLLTPVLALGSFFIMLVGPFSLGGILGDSLWTRLARANTERRFRPLIIPLLVFLVLPMVLCGMGGSKAHAITTPLLLSAGLGAVLLGAVGGGLCGGRGGKAQ
jgi:hypothetical protein